MAYEQQIREAALEYGRSSKRANAGAALACGAIPALGLGWLWSPEPWAWVAGIFLGLLYANFFEYIYHRWLLHTPGGFLTKYHLIHHSTVGLPDEPAHVTIGGGPQYVALLFAVNGLVVVPLDWLLGFGLAPGMFLAFGLYMITTEEVHWRIHVGAWLPGAMRLSREHHFAHHDYPNGRFNVFFPLFDWLFGTTR
jgi:hypothetical protein